jgi:glutamate 5-kinase
LGAVAIINENDTISTSELTKITFGDNDILAAVVAAALRANLLVLLTVVDGLLDGEHKPVRLVANLAQARQLVRDEKSAMGKGGMDSKLEAARMVTEAGEVMAVANGRDPDVLLRLLDGEEVGTLFAPLPKKRSSRSRWIGAVRSAGSIVVDGGATSALREKNRSLLPAGIVRVVGTFEPGDVVSIVGIDGVEIARGLSNYTAGAIEKIRGRKTAEVRQMLGEAAYDEVIHRDNLIVC